MTAVEASPDFSQWIGRQETDSDRVTRRLVREFQATLAPHLHGGADDTAPLLIHWCLAPPAAPLDRLGQDGHPATGGFLPPVPLPRRMWAAGQLTFVDDLRVDDVVSRTSTVASIERKSGRTGDLWFVGVRHELSTARGVALTEVQTLVYRDAGRQAASAPTPSLEPGPGDMQVAFPTVRLFRYSSLTFNGHRIHYDEPYAIGVEGYAGLVVHGPLQATLLAHAAARIAGASLRTFSFRGVSPLICGAPATIRASRDGDRLKLCMCDAAGGMTMEASAGFG